MAAADGLAIHRQRKWLALLVVVVVTAGVFANTLPLGFTWDDNWLILDNPRIDDPSYVRYLFLENELWRPLKRLSFMADYALWGPEHPAGFHLTNLLLHVGVAAALYGFGLCLGLPVATAAIVSLLFAVHPVQVEAVANISHRKESMALLFYLLGFIAYLRATAERTGGGLITRLASRIGLVDPTSPGLLARAELMGYTFLCYLLGMLSKEVAVVMFPVMVVVYEVVVARGSWQQRLRRTLVFLAPIGLVLLLFTFKGYLGTIPRRFSAEQIEWITHGQTSSYGTIVLTAIKAFGAYVGMLVLPWPLYLDRYFPLAQGFSDPGVLAGLVRLMIFVVGLVWSARRAPLVFFALAWFGLNLLPVSNLVPLTYWLLAERFLYVPSVGFALLLGVALQGLWRGNLEVIPAKMQRVLAACGLILLLAFQAALTVRQNRVWTNSQTLWEHTLTFNPTSYRGLYDYGRTLHEQGELAAAEELYRQAIDVRPGFFKPRSALATVLLDLGRFAESIDVAEECAQISPEDPDPFMIIGNAQTHLGNPELAVQAYREVVLRDPEDLNAKFNLALVLHASGRSAQALEVIEQGLEIRCDTDLLDLHDLVHRTLDAERRNPELSRE